MFQGHKTQTVSLVCHANIKQLVTITCRHIAQPQRNLVHWWCRVRLLPQPHLCRLCQQSHYSYKSSRTNQSLQHRQRTLLLQCHSSFRPHTQLHTLLLSLLLLTTHSPPCNAYNNNNHNKPNKLFSIQFMVCTSRLTYILLSCVYSKINSILFWV